MANYILSNNLNVSVDQTLSVNSCLYAMYTDLHGMCKHINSKSIFIINNLEQAFTKCNWFNSINWLKTLGLQRVTKLNWQLTGFSLVLRGTSLSVVILKRNKKQLRLLIQWQGIFYKLDWLQVYVWGVQPTLKAQDHWNFLSIKCICWIYVTKLSGLTLHEGVTTSLFSLSGDNPVSLILTLWSLFFIS